LGGGPDARTGPAGDPRRKLALVREASRHGLRGVVDEVFPIDLGDVERAKALLLGLSGLSARDALHAAVMRRRGVAAVMSFDTGFDRVAGLERLG
jgi:predicted nucleic acid-binding protein